MSSSKTYSFKHTNVIAGSFKMGGFGEEGGVTITRDETDFNKTIGADGRPSRSYIASTAGTVAITLMQTSESNAVLSQLLATDTRTLKGQVPLVVQDTLGGSVYTSTDAWLQGPPEVSLNKGIEEYTWTFDCADLAMYVAGGQGGFVAGAVNSISSALGLD
ncbi:MAG: DUF3277 family protein [Psychroserpens sp.]|nr:DUF3277 family protein [Psychroserpens sp.]